jgi:hypothetical protein
MNRTCSRMLDNIMSWDSSGTTVVVSPIERSRGQPPAKAPHPAQGLTAASTGTPSNSEEPGGNPTAA